MKKILQPPKQQQQKQANQPVKVYNKNNVKITLKDVSNIFKKFGLKQKPTRLDLYQEAVTHKSYAKSSYVLPKEVKDGVIDKHKILLTDTRKDEVELQEMPYDRLEFLGDSSLRLIVSEYLYKRYESENEGFLTVIRTRIENSATLAPLAKYLGLAKFLLISEHNEITYGREYQSYLEDMFEALLGCIQLEFGYDVCRQFVTNILENKLDLSTIIAHNTNYKGQLNAYYLDQKWSSPKYAIESSSGTGTNIMYRMYVTDNENNRVGTGVGNSKTKATQLAAKKALQYFGVLDDVEDDSDTDDEE